MAGLGDVSFFLFFSLVLLPSTRDSDTPSPIYTLFPDLGLLLVTLHYDDASTPIHTYTYILYNMLVEENHKTWSCLRLYDSKNHHGLPGRRGLPVCHCQYYYHPVTLFSP